MKKKAFFLNESLKSGQQKITDVKKESPVMHRYQKLILRSVKKRKERKEKQL